MNNQNSVIIYRSKNEQIMDEFLHENPEYVLGFVGIIIVVFIVAKFLKR
jgi:hypothetical protein